MSCAGADTIDRIDLITCRCPFWQICKKAKAFFHSDIAQMAGKMPVDVDDMGIDIASISSHKVRAVSSACVSLFPPSAHPYAIILQLYGPKGMGALYVRRRPRVRLEPLFSGGGQERGLRSGTLSPALCVGMGAAARVCAEEMHRDTEWITFLSNRLKRYTPQSLPLV